MARKLFVNKKTSFSLPTKNICTPGKTKTARNKTNQTKTSYKSTEKGSAEEKRLVFALLLKCQVLRVFTQGAGKHTLCLPHFSTMICGFFLLRWNDQLTSWSFWSSRNHQPEALILHKGSDFVLPPQKSQNFQRELIKEAASSDIHLPGNYSKSPF